MVDPDTDQIPSSIEDSVPNATTNGSGDGNGDGVADAAQTFVASFPAFGGNTFVTLVTGSQAPFTQVATAARPDDLPADSVTPVSGVSFTVSNLTVGGTETIELLLPFDPTLNGLLKKNRITGQYDNIARSISNIGTTKTSVTFTLVDGGPYDADGVADGKIVDPAFPATLPQVIGTASSGGSLGAWLLAPLALFGLFRRAARGRRDARANVATAGAARPTTAPQRRTGTAFLVILLIAALLAPLVGQAATTKMDINVREAASLKSPIVTSLKKGTAVTVLEITGEFAKVRSPQGREGYLKAKHLDDVEAVAPKPVVAEAAPVVQPQSEPVAEVAPAPEPVAVAEPVAAPEPVATPVVVSATPSPWSITASLGLAVSGVDQAKFQSALQAANTGVTVTELDDSATAYALWAAYRLHKHFALEAGALHLGEYEARYTATAFNADAATKVFASDYPVGGPGLALAAKGLMQAGNWELAARAGVFHSLDSEVEINVGIQQLTTDGEDISPLLGLSAAYVLNPNWSLGASLDAYQLNDSLLVLGVTLGWTP